LNKAVKIDWSDLWDEVVQDSSRTTILNISTEPLVAWVINSTQNALSQSSLEEKIKDELIREIQEEFWRDLNDIVVNSRIPFRIEKDKFDEHVAERLLKLSYYLVLKWREELWKNNIKVYGALLDYFGINKSYFEAREISESAEKIWKSAIAYVPGDFIKVLELQSEFSDFLGSKTMNTMDSENQGYNSSAVYPRKAEQVRKAVQWQYESSDSLWNVIGGDVYQKLKISILSEIVTKFLLWNSKNFNEESCFTFFVAFSKLIECVTDDLSNSTEVWIMRWEMIKNIFWDSISKSKFRSFTESALYRKITESENISSEVRVFIAKIAMTHSDIFLHEEDIVYGKFFQYISTITLKSRQDSLIKFLSQIKTEDIWWDIDLCILILLNLEDIPYTHKLQSDDIEFIKNYFCNIHSDWSIERIKVNWKILAGVLKEIDYDTFCLMRAASEHPEWWNLVSCLISEQKEFPQAGKNIVIIWEFQQRMKCIPPYFSLLHAQAEEIIDLKNESYRLESNDLLSKIASIEESNDFKEIYTTHKAFFEYFDQDKWTILREKISHIHNSLWKCTINERLNFITSLSSIDYDDVILFLDACENQDISTCGIINLESQELFDFIQYLKNHNIFDDIPTALELFLEDKEKTGVNNEIIHLDSNSQLRELFWKSLGDQITSIWFQDTVIQEILNSWESLDAWDRQTLWIFLTKHKKNLQTLHNNDFERFLRKIFQIWRVLHWLKSMWIHTMKKPENLYSHIFFTKNTQIRIQQLIEIFDENDDDIDVQNNYDLYVWEIIKYIRDWDNDVLLQQLWIAVENMGTEENTPESENFTNNKGVINSRHAIKNTHIFDEIKTALGSNRSELVDLYRSLLWDNSPIYDREIYAILIANWHNLEWENDTRLLDKSISLLLSSQWQISIDSIWNLLKSICVDSFSSNQTQSILTTITDIISKHIYTFSQRSFSLLIYKITFLPKFSQADKLLEQLFENSNMDNISFTYSDLIYKSLYWLYDYRELDFIKPVIKKLFKQVITMLPDTKKWVLWFVQLYNLYWRWIPEKLDVEYRKIIWSKQKKNRREEELYRMLQSSFSNVLQWQYIDGFEMDVVVPKEQNWLSTTLNFESDGSRYHTWFYALKNRRRDLYLANRSEPIQVKRVRADMPYSARENNVKQIVWQIRWNFAS